MDSRHRPLAAALFVLAACGADAGPPSFPDARAVPVRDGAPIDECAESSATVGRCEIVGTGGDCAGTPDEDRQFVELGYGDDVAMILGPQGAHMFVLALQTTGIEPGDPANPIDPSNPDVDILLSRNGYEVARYRGTPGFAPDADDPTLLEAAGLFVVLDFTSDELDALVGNEVIATAHVTDSDGAQRCGQVMFVAQR